VYENPNPLPRFVLVDRVRQASTAAAALGVLRSRVSIRATRPWLKAGHPCRTLRVSVTSG